MSLGTLGKTQNLFVIYGPMLKIHHQRAHNVLENYHLENWYFPLLQILSWIYHHPNPTTKKTTMFINMYKENLTNYQYLIKKNLQIITISFYYKLWVYNSTWFLHFSIQLYLFLRICTHRTTTYLISTLCPQYHDVFNCNIHPH